MTFTLLSVLGPLTLGRQSIKASNATHETGVNIILETEPLKEKQGEVGLLFRLNPDEAVNARDKKELIKRLTHIERLAKQKNYAEIEKLLQENYV